MLNSHRPPKLIVGRFYREEKMKIYVYKYGHGYMIDTDKSGVRKKVRAEPYSKYELKKTLAAPTYSNATVIKENS